MQENFGRENEVKLNEENCSVGGLLIEYKQVFLVGYFAAAVAVYVSVSVFVLTPVSLLIFEHGLKF